MPRATVTQEVERKNLKTLEGGWVDLRTLSFHEMQTRADIVSRMYQEDKVGNMKKKKRSDEEVIRGYFEIMNVKVTEFEFRNCITDHNLEDENGELIDFRQPMQKWRLDPKIGAEIGRYIDDLNLEDDGEELDLDPLEVAPISSSPTEEPAEVS